MHCSQSLQLFVLALVVDKLFRRRIFSPEFQLLFGVVVVVDRRAFLLLLLFLLTVLQKPPRLGTEVDLLLLLLLRHHRKVALMVEKDIGFFNTIIYLGYRLQQT